MKKILIIIMVLAASSVATFAINPADYAVFYKMNNTATFNGLVRYLDADYEQVDNLKYIFDITESKVKLALNAQNEVDAEKALNFNLANTKSILTDAQYKKYLLILNLTIINSNNEVLLSEK